MSVYPPTYISNEYAQDSWTSRRHGSYRHRPRLLRAGIREYREYSLPANRWTQINFCFPLGLC